MNKIKPACIEAELFLQAARLKIVTLYCSVSSLRSHILAVLVAAFSGFSIACLPSPECNGTDLTCSDSALLPFYLSSVVDPAVAPTTTPTTTTVNRWLAVGHSGTIAYSEDGQTNWQSADVGGADLRGVTYGDAGFVAVGASGRIVTSTNGEAGTWSTQSSGTGLDLEGVAFGAGIYVAVGGTGTSDVMLSSPDGITWTDRTLTLGNRLEGVEYLNGGFVAFGRGGVRATSTDGISWSNANAGAQDWVIAAYGNGVYLMEDATGSIHTAATIGGFPNATGTHVSAELNGSAFVSGAGLFALGGDDGTMYTTSNGTGAATDTGDAVFGVAHHMATDGANVVVVSESGRIEYSADLTTYTPTIVGSNDWRSVVYTTITQSQ